MRTLDTRLSEKPSFLLLLLHRRLLVMAVYYFTSSINPTTIRLCLLLSLLVVGMASADQLSSNFDAKSCLEALSTIQSAVNSAVSNEARMEESLLRLHFHDCFVNECECDTSILLDDISRTFKEEKTAIAIDTIKSQLESLCPNVISCADILAVAVIDSVVALSEPSSSWSRTVSLGRRDLLADTKQKYGRDEPSFSHDQVQVPPSGPNPCTYVPGRPGRGGVGHCTKH